MITLVRLLSTLNMNMNKRNMCVYVFFIVVQMLSLVSVQGLVILSINFICIHLTNNLNACLKCNYILIDLFTIAYIYNAVLYIFTTLSNVWHFSNLKILYLKIIFPLQSKFYVRNCPISTYLKKRIYILYCLNLNTDLDPGLDEQIHYKSNYYQ